MSGVAVSSVAIRVAHLWYLSLAFANATRKPVSAIPFTNGRSPCALKDLVHPAPCQQAS